MYDMYPDLADMKIVQSAEPTAIVLAIMHSSLNTIVQKSKWKRALSVTGIIYSS